MQETKQMQLFTLGQVVATPGALAALEKTGQSPAEFLARHVQGDQSWAAHTFRKWTSFSTKGA